MLSSILLKKWIGSAVLISTSIMSIQTAIAMTNPTPEVCSIEFRGDINTVGSQLFVDVASLNPGSSQSLSATATIDGIQFTSGNSPLSICATSTLPDNDDTVCENNTNFIPLGSTLYLNVAHNDIPPISNCLFSVTLPDNLGEAVTGNQITLRLPAQTPTSVPIFTPIGLFAAIAGFLWFGNRRRTLKVIK